MNDITIVTAFYDIDRKNWDYYSRDTSYYFECFDKLCQLQNKIIVFIPGIIIYGGSFMWSCNMCKNIKNNLRDLKRESIK